MSFQIGSIANSFFSKSPPKTEEKKPEIKLMEPLDQVKIGQSLTDAELLPGVTQGEADGFSEKALLLDEIRYLSKLGAGTCLILTGIGAVGAVGMTAASLHGMVKAKDPLDKVDYGTGVGWGIQSGLYIANQLGRASASVIPVANTIGALGGLTEIGVGAKKLYDGIKKSDSKKKIMGMFDIGIGVTWAGASVLFGGPIGSALFLGLSGAKLLYKNKDKIKTRINKLLRRAPKQAQQSTVNTQKTNASPVIIVNVPETGATGKEIKEAKKTAAAVAEAHKSQDPQVIIVNVPDNSSEKQETKAVNKSSEAEPQKTNTPQVIIMNIPEEVTAGQEPKPQI